MQAVLDIWLGVDAEDTEEYGAALKLQVRWCAVFHTSAPHIWNFVFLLNILNYTHL